VDDFVDRLHVLRKNYPEMLFVRQCACRGLSLPKWLTVVEVLGFRAKIVYDGSKADGTPGKLVDVWQLSGPGLEPEGFAQALDAPTPER
jgi:hypothetical protein